ncbi:hypothetical protein ACFFNY_11335 [Paenibacillus hodogayensis]|uniref:Sugar ABC transporter substrate-binding protein n=1 Tax=Paenibacillus hodogayensis TaxID=279208 RepID=A0ABV5VV53_9BACL
MSSKVNKSVLAGATAVLLATTVLTACSGSPDKAAAVDSEPTAKPLKKDIKVLLSHNNSGFASKGPEDKKAKYYAELSRLSGYNLSYEFLGHDIDYR